MRQKDIDWISGLVITSVVYFSCSVTICVVGLSVEGHCHRCAVSICMFVLLDCQNKTEDCDVQHMKH